MKKTKLFKTMVSLTMSATMMLSATLAFAEANQVTSDSIAPTPQNAEVTDGNSLVDFEVENAVGKAKPFTDEDLQVIAEALGADSISNDGRAIISEGSVFSVDWEHSELQLEDIWTKEVIAYWFTRDESDKLVFEKRWTIGFIGYSKDADGNKVPSGEAGAAPWVMSSPYTFDWEWMEWLSSSEADRLPDLIQVRAWYNPTEFDEWGDWTSAYWTGSSYIVDKENFVFHFKEEANTDNDTTTTEESYVLDLSNRNAVLSNEDFASILEENKTKDVVIKSNNGVTFTFKKGTMKAVDGKDSYDFSTTINNDYGTVTGLPSHVTADNFVQRIDFNYSGQLPAEASIRFYVGVEYAGQTLFYSQLLGDSTISLVQSVTVDADGYITVVQNHCSSYIVTKEDVTTPTTTGNSSEQAPNAKTGDNADIALWLILAFASAGCALTVRKKFQTSL